MLLLLLSCQIHFFLVLNSKCLISHLILVKYQKPNIRVNTITLENPNVCLSRLENKQINQNILAVAAKALSPSIFIAETLHYLTLID